MEVDLVAANFLIYLKQRLRRQVRHIARAGLRPSIAGLARTRRAQVRKSAANCGLASFSLLGHSGVHVGCACVASLRLTSGSSRSLRSLGPANAGPLTKRVCRAWHVTMSVKVRQPGFRRAEG